MTGVFRTSTDLDQIAPALVAVFAVSRTVGTDASAKIDTKGGDGYRYDYATLSQVYGAVRAALADAGVVPMQTTVIDEAAGAVLLRCSTRLLHLSGQWIENDAVVSVDSRGRAQQWGAAMSYARRYSLLLALSVATGDDDAASIPPPRPLQSVSQVKKALLIALSDDQTLARASWERLAPGDGPFSDIEAHQIVRAGMMEATAVQAEIDAAARAATVAAAADTAGSDATDDTPGDDGEGPE
jgi:hypothetical protein